MATEKRVWRGQFEVPYGAADPKVTLYLGPVETDDETGDISVRQDTRWPVEMPLSQVLAYLQGGIKHSDLAAERAKLIAADFVKGRSEKS